MFRKIYQGGSSRKQGPRPAMREPDHELPREAQVRPCEWALDEFMDRAGFKDELRMYKMPASRISYLTSACNIIISPIPSCGGLSFIQVQYSYCPV